MQPWLKSNLSSWCSFSSERLTWTKSRNGIGNCWSSSIQCQGESRTCRENSRPARPQDCPFSGLRNLFRTKKCLNKDHSRSEVLFFQFWTLTETVWCINDNLCQWWSSLAQNRQLVLVDDPPSHVSHHQVGRQTHQCLCHSLYLEAR